MKTNALFPILFIQNNLIKKKSGTDIFYQIIVHAHFREILSGYFLFSRFDWSIFVTQLVVKHMNNRVKIIIYNTTSSPNYVDYFSNWSRIINSQGCIHLLKIIAGITSDITDRISTSGNIQSNFLKPW
jgi:hypothetical protein